MAAILGRMAAYSGQMLTWDSTPPVLPDEQGRYRRLKPPPSGASSRSSVYRDGFPTPSRNYRQGNLVVPTHKLLIFSQHGSTLFPDQPRPLREFSAVRGRPGAVRAETKLRPLRIGHRTILNVNARSWHLEPHA